MQLTNHFSAIESHRLYTRDKISAVRDNHGKKQLQVRLIYGTIAMLLLLRVSPDVLSEDHPLL